MDSKKSIQNLAENIHSLLGIKARLNSGWIKSVCDIIKNLPCEGSQSNIEKKDKDDESGSDISKIKEQHAALTAYINQLRIQRRQVLNDFLDLKGNIRVFCRIRPTTQDILGRLRPLVALDSSIVLKLADNKSKSYSFDRVFHPGSSQDEVFSEVEPVIKSVLDGYNACIFAYGQTGTGKTFTMEGTPDSPGIVPRAIEALFKQAADGNHEFLINFSMLEIYLGNLKDLLVPQPTKATDPLPPCLSIQADPYGGIEIENLVGIQVCDFNQALKLYRLGCRFRSTASTNSNRTSSRSHCMIRILITCFNAPERRRETNKIWLVDLGGSERVMKTKAWGRRLDEGKAINLSLSALGDVIYALQRKRSHIPYRNSKLTQVLKDSLGEDSKTLMLVHVSSKEEDLCETICSLNFATRVKSIHLGHEESVEVRKQNEFAITNMQQKIKKIEDERLHVGRKIKTLNERLENLTGIAPSLEEQKEASYLSSEGPVSDLEILKNKNGNVTAASLSKLPRYMRPTFCSRRKSGIDNQASVGRDKIRSRRSSSSHRAESVTFPMKNNSDYNSDCSISKSTCVIDLNNKVSADNETEYSQDASEYDVKLIVEEKTSEQTAISEKDQLSQSQKKGSQRQSICNFTKFSKVDNWLDLHKNEPPVSGYAYMSKWVPAIPTREKKHIANRQKRAEVLDDEKESPYSFATQKIDSGNNKEMEVDIGPDRRPTLELTMDKPPTLKDLFAEKSISGLISPSYVMHDQTILQTQDILDYSFIQDNECGSPPSDVSCGELEVCNDENAVYMTTKQAVKQTTQCSDSTLQMKSEYQFCSSDLDKSIISSKEYFSVCTPVLKQGWICKGVSSRLGAEEPPPREMRPNPCSLRSQKALFIEDRNQKDPTATLVKSQEIIQNKGVQYNLKQISYATAVLGLGFLDLGFDDNFFFGLIL